MLITCHFLSSMVGSLVMSLDVDSGRPMRALIADALDIAHSVTGDPDVEFVTMRLPHHERGLRPIGDVIAPLLDWAGITVL